MCATPIKAIGYLRKSTDGESNGKVRQEKSIPQQKREIERLAAGKYEIVGWEADPGVSGWKRGAQRPGFQRMLNKSTKMRKCLTRQQPGSKGNSRWQKCLCIPTSQK